MGERELKLAGQFTLADILRLANFGLPARQRLSLGAPICGDHISRRRASKWAAI